ncbi:hypothetical protein O7635_20220 [Asanoa sp. WMMD1127]|uniref:hypothetical protein n=1 Tax=Asanoa sp. WMMD1127 TaxID=3016107 RepID=UPI0024178BD1|nr:hypothetical protein [Asanoa sp. WMMD1127]MDG4824182.1 hypothetical protein [Asanoa sp. WMMD1127]
MAWLLMAVGGCAVARADTLSRTSPVWLTDDAIYFLRAADSGPAEMWVRDVRDDDERRVAAPADVPDACGPLDYLFRVPDGRLGIALACGGTARLLAYDPAARAFARLGDLGSRPAQVTLTRDRAGGFAAGADDGCWSLSTVALPAGTLTPALPELTCAAGASARSPVLTRWGGLVFAATRDRLRGDHDDRRWSVHLAGFDGIPFKGIGPTFEGLPDLDLSPDEGTAVVTASRFDRSRLMLVDLGNGETRELRASDRVFEDPTFAPDGRHVAYSDRSTIAVVAVPAWSG